MPYTLKVCWTQKRLSCVLDALYEQVNESPWVRRVIDDLDHWQATEKELADRLPTDTTTIKPAWPQSDIHELLLLLGEKAFVLTSAGARATDAARASELWGAIRDISGYQEANQMAIAHMRRERGA